MINNNLTYISLFSSAGVGCYAFKQLGYECIATSEIKERRLNIQKINNKCKYADGYILGDITKPEIIEKLSNEITRWKKLGNDCVDLVIATPPCQGMSVANHKKTDIDINRNSLIVDSVNIINSVKPRFFIFENVSTFWKTGCYTEDLGIISIGEMIETKLHSNYSFTKKVINFKNYGSNSSRTRTLVIGVRKDLANYISPLELFPDYVEPKKLKDVIGDFPNLKWGEYDKNDFFHSFRIYPQHMREWISDLKEGQSAFENKKIEKKPHRLINGEIVINKAKNADKYKRQIFEKVGPCIHTRNDQLASQNTIHPKDDRVFSIRELMSLMTIPKDFCWLDKDLKHLNSLTNKQKKIISKKEELNIRQSIGEAVPTKIFHQIGLKINFELKKKKLNLKEITEIINSENLENPEALKNFLISDYKSYCNTTISNLIETANAKKYKHSAFYTNKEILTYIFNNLPDIEKNEITIIEPSVGAGNFLPFLYKKYQNKKKVNLFVVDIDNDIIEILKKINKPPQNFSVTYLCRDFLDIDFPNVDFVIGNPPFTKLKKSYFNKYKSKHYVFESNNIASYFLQKAINISTYVSLIMPKNFLNTPDYKSVRNNIQKNTLESIIDFGEIGFKGVLVETINIMVNKTKKSTKILIKSVPQNHTIFQNIKYITDTKLPYWVIYRNTKFDKIYNKMIFDVFEVIRDRQITNKNTCNQKLNSNYIRVVKSRNINNDGSEIIKINNYDTYIDLQVLEKLSIYKYFNRSDIYLTPNMTYKPRIIKKEKGYIVNGSVAILIPKSEFILSNKQMKYFASKEYRDFYKIARNYQTRSLNIDKSSCFWFGILKQNCD